MPTRAHTVRLLAVAASASLLVLPCSARAANDLAISQVYGGGGNSGAPFTNDFVEIYNRGTSCVSLGGKSVQYTSATGTGNFSATALPSLVLAPGQYFLVQESGGATGSPLPTPDATGTLNMSASAGKVALVNSATALGCNGGSSPCSAAQQGLIIDLIGYGNANFFEGAAAPALTNTTAAIRKSGGATDTDNNSADFLVAAPTPRNSASATNVCVSLQFNTTVNPAALAAGYTTTFSVTVIPAANPPSTDIAVSGDLSAIGGSTSQPFSDAGGGVFSLSATVASNISLGPKTVPILVTDAQGRSGTGSISLSIVPGLAIHDIQGAGVFSPWANATVQTEGVVTAIKTNGYFIQAPDSEADGDPGTSEGVFVFTNGVPPAAAAVGNRVRLAARVQDFIPSSDPLSPPVTELSGTLSVSVVSTGNALPLLVNLGPADFNPAGGVSQLAKYEGMRVHVDTIDIVAPTGGTINEANATSTSSGAFYGVLPGTPRPFRERGIEAPAPAPAGVPQFDANPERVRVDTDGQIGSVAINVATGDRVSDLTGVLDFTFRSYTILPDPGSPPVVTSYDLHALPVRPADAEGEISVASFNMERFFDTTKDSGTEDVALSAAGFQRRLAKASLAIRNVLRLPDVIGVEEMEHLSTLQAVAAQIDQDAVAAGQTPPAYQAYLFEGNDIGGIDSGFLVKASRIQVTKVEQIDQNADGSSPATYTQPDGTQALLNDRPPVVLTATIRPAGKELPFAVTIIVNHLRSLSGIEGSDGDRIRHKRLAQAEFLANLISQHQSAGEQVISIGDYNAFDVNDGYVDVINTVRGGAPHPSEDVVGEPNQLVNPPLIDLAPADPVQHYSYVFDGNAQVLDHIIVTQSLTVNEFTYARNNADFPEVLRNDATRPERISDHDMPVAYVAVPRDTVPPVVTVTGVIDGAIYRPATLPTAGCSTSDDVSGVAASAVLSITGGNADGTGVFTATCSGGRDNVGNVAADVSIQYTVDGLPPTVALTGVIEGTYFRLGTEPDIACVTTDDLSGVAAPATLVREGGNPDGTGTFTVRCTAASDNAGNVSAEVVVHYGVDGRAPVVLLTGITEGAVYRPGGVPTATCTTSDDFSGVAADARLVISGGDADGNGAFTATCTGAADNAGNVAANVSVHFQVDGTPPVVAITGVVEGQISHDRVFPQCLTLDDLSGVRTQAFLTISGGNPDGSGFFTATCSGATDNAGNVALAVVVHYAIDFMPPVVTLNGPAEGGMYRPGAVPVPVCTTIDDIAGVALPALPVVSGGSPDGTGLFVATCTGAMDRAGNVAADVSVHYLVDGLAPAVAVTGVSEGVVYRAGAVPVVGCATADDLSGVRTPAFLEITGGNSDGTGFFAATCTGAVDRAGNVAGDVSVHYAVDGMPPVVTLSGPLNGATYVLGAVPAASCSAVDDIAGIAVQPTLSLSGGDANGLGIITATCAGAEDNVGNISPNVSVTYTVAGYGFGGFGPPAGGAIIVARSGSTVPLKFQIRDWTGALVTDTAIVRAIEYAPNPACNGAPSGGWQPALSANPVGLRFDAGAQGFTFQWKTTGIGEGCYSVAVTTVDTLRHATLVQIRGAQHASR